MQWRLPTLQAVPVTVEVLVKDRRPGGDVVTEDQSSVMVDRDLYDPGPNPARVEGSVGFTVSENYRSISVRASCQLPSRPGRQDALARTDQAFETCYTALNRQLDTLVDLARAVGMRPAVVRDAIPGGDVESKPGT